MNKNSRPSNTEADGPIMASYTLNKKLLVMTATSTYRVRIRKRHRDKGKPPLAILRKL